MSSQSIRENLQRYHALRKHRDEKFSNQLSKLEQWKTQQLETCYAPLLDDRRYAPLLTYYFRKIFTGIDLSEFRDADRAVDIIEKFFTGTQMLQAALAFNALTGEINEVLTQHLFEELSLKKIRHEDYLEACHSKEVVSLMAQQVEQFELFAQDLNTTVNNRAIRTAIRMAKIPAKLGGFSNLYGLIADGLELLKRIDNPEEVVTILISHERLVLSRLQDRQSPLFPTIKVKL